MKTFHKQISKAEKKKEQWIYLALLAIILYVIVYESVFVLGPSNFGDDSVYLNYANDVLHNRFIETGSIFGLRLLNIYPIAFFYAFFGVNNLTSSAWAIISFAGCVIIAFYLGRELYNKYVGLLAALLLSFMPLFVALSGTPSPNVVEAFLTGLAVLAIVFARNGKSKKWYFVSGVALVASILATESSGIIYVVLFVYLGLEFLRKRFSIDRKSMYLLYGLLAAAVLLGVFNYLSSGDPFITFTEASTIYGTASTTSSQYGILINQDLGYYFPVLFPYNMINAFSGHITSGNLNPVAIWNDMFHAEQVYAGFYFYVFVVAALFLLLRWERRAYLPLLWVGIAFIYLEFGPISVSLVPFKYILTHRLQRYLTILGIPLVVAISIALIRFGEGFERSKLLAKMARKKDLAKKTIAWSVPIAISVFLIVTAIPANQFWYISVTHQMYDQEAIAAYLNKLPNSTQIYFQDGFSNLLEYLGYNNLTRVHAYDGTKNCSNIPVGSYVVLPKYIKVFNLSYTPDPSTSCPSWVLKLYPEMPGNFSSAIIGPSVPFAAQLYYVPNS